MRKFVLIDHSLRDLGGHHYGYATSVLQAAQDDGWQPVLITNCRFAHRQALPSSWDVHTLFRRESYSRYTLDTQSRNTTAATAGKFLWRRLRKYVATRTRARHVEVFSEDCARLFARVPIDSGDLVFIATASELDLSGLSDFLADLRGSMRPEWHLLFHFGFFAGREPDYAAQTSACSAMRAVFSQALRRTQSHQLHFHCTTEQLTDQYLQLGVAPFSTLPYPVHAQFRPRPLAERDNAVQRIACLGHSRREKGYALLPAVVRALWRDWFGAGRAVLVVQMRRSRKQRDLLQLVRSLPAAGNSAVTAVEFVSFPLPLTDFAALVGGSDVGLLLYDPARYYARCSGVLLEMLACAVPVIVPAGGWLAAQIEADNQRYLSEVAARVGRHCSVAAGDDFVAPTGASAILVSCTWQKPAVPGTYLRLDLSDSRTGAEVTPPVSAVVGAPASGELVYSLMPVPAGAQRLRLQLRSAWASAPAPITSISWAAVSQSMPAGARGLTIADSTQVPRLLMDILEHGNHYRQHALAHAQDVAAAHSAASVVSVLTHKLAPPNARRQMTS